MRSAKDEEDWLELQIEDLIIKITDKIIHNGLT